MLKKKQNDTEVSRTRSILCVGQLVADIVVHPVERVDFGVDTVRVDSIEALNGGDAMNVAVNLARLQAPVRFAGKTGRDSFGEYLLGRLDELGIAHDGMEPDETLPTSTTIVLINGAGERTFLHCAGANQSLCRADIQDEWLPKDGIVFVGGTYILPKLDGEGTADLFAVAHEKGALTAMDVTHDTTGRWMEVIRPCLKHLDCFLPSIDQAQAITGCALPEDIAAKLIGEGVKMVAIKLGSDGCYVKSAHESFFQHAYPAKVVDTTGAGDAFVAGFLAGLAQNKPLFACAQMGCAAGSITVRRIGATTDALTPENTQQIIKGGA